MELKLHKEGHDVVVAYDGQEGVGLLLKNKYDVVFLDLMMPIMNGFQVLERLKTADITMPTIFVLSNLTQPEDEERVLRLGAKKFFVKSNTPLAQIVEEINNL